eukprot:6181915-Pleurochrysis_carterae.AAC.4
MQADRDKFLEIGDKVGPAEMGREVLGPFVAQGGAMRLCGDDVIDVEQHNQHLVAPDHVTEARVVLGPGEAKRDEGLAGRLVPLAAGGGAVAVHVANLCNQLMAVLVPPLVALRYVGIYLLVGWPVSLRVGLGYITALQVKVMLSGDGKDGAQRGVLDGGRECVLKVAILLQAMPPKNATCFLKPVSLDLVQGAQLQGHGQVWWKWYKVQPSWHVEQPMNLGVVMGAVPLAAFVDIGDVGNVLKGRKKHGHRAPSRS